MNDREELPKLSDERLDALCFEMLGEDELGCSTLLAFRDAVRSIAAPLVARIAELEVTTNAFAAENRSLRTQLASMTRERDIVAEHAVEDTDRLRTQLAEVQKDAQRHKRAADIFASVMRLVREYPAFDEGGPLPEAMDMAFRQEIHPAVAFIAEVQATYPLSAPKDEV
jgi:hypothetical protein